MRGRRTEELVDAMAHAIANGHDDAAAALLTRLAELDPKRAERIELAIVLAEFDLVADR